MSNNELEEFWWYAATGRVEELKVLLKNLEYWGQWPRPRELTHGLELAVKNEHTDVVALLVALKDVNPDYALSLALQTEQREIVGLLLPRAPITVWHLMECVANNKWVSVHMLQEKCPIQFLLFTFNLLMEDKKLEDAEGIVQLRGAEILLNALRERPNRYMVKPSAVEYLEQRAAEEQRARLKQETGGMTLASPPRKI